MFFVYDGFMVGQPKFPFWAVFSGCGSICLLVAGALGLGLVGLRHLRFCFFSAGSNPETERAPTQKNGNDL